MGLVRQLDSYPTGRKRQRVLAAAVLASLICSYEGAIAPVVPLLLADLDISLTTYGLISAGGAVAGAVSALIGGRLTDTYGRVRLLIPLMIVCALLCYVTALVQSTEQFLVMRMVLAFVDGMALATTAPLVRDFSPRMGRATALAFWSCGPVGANLLAAAVAGATLPLFDDAWQSQFVIQGTIALVISLAVIMNVAELSPEVRSQIQHTEAARILQEAEARGVQPEKPGMLTLLRHPVMWFHLIGVSFYLIIYLTMTIYGQTMLVETFGITSAQASTVMMGYWVMNVIALIVGGLISDRLQLRRIFTLASIVVGAAAVLWMTMQMISPAGASVASILPAGMAVSFGLAFGFGAWMATFSENGEDIDPRSQGSAWGLYSGIIRGMGVVVLVVAPFVVASAGWDAWMWVCLAGVVTFLTATFFTKGPWFHRPQLALVPSDAPDLGAAIPAPRGSEAAVEAQLAPIARDTLPD